MESLRITRKITKKVPMGWLVVAVVMEGKSFATRCLGLVSFLLEIEYDILHLMMIVMRIS